MFTFEQKKHYLLDVICFALSVAAIQYVILQYRNSIYFGAFPGIAAFITGFIGLLVSRHRAGSLEKRYFAMAGVILSIAAAFGVILLPYYHQPKSNITDIAAVNLKTLNAAMKQYQSDNNNCYPIANRWCDSLMPYTNSAEAFRNIERPGLDCAFAFNIRLSCAEYDKIDEPNQTVCMFESKAGWNGTGGSGLAQSSNIYPIWISFVSGQSKKARVLEPVRW